MKKMMPFVASIALIMMASLVAGAGTMAWFSQAESAAITITAGTVNLQLSKEGTSWFDGLTFDFPTGFAPGDEYEVHVYLRNMGTGGAKTVWVYGDTLVDTDGLSDVIYITDAAYTDSSAYGSTESGYTGYWVHPGGGTYYADNNVFGGGDGKLSLREFATADINANEYMRFYWGMWYDKDYLEASGASTQQVRLVFTFDSTAGDEYQGDTCDFNIVFLATDDQGYDLIWPLPT